MGGGSGIDGRGGGGGRNRSPDSNKEDIPSCSPRSGPQDKHGNRAAHTTEVLLFRPWPSRGCGCGSRAWPCLGHVRDRVCRGREAEGGVRESQRARGRPRESECVKGPKSVRGDRARSTAAWSEWTGRLATAGAAASRCRRRTKIVGMGDADWPCESPVPQLPPK